MQESKTMNWAKKGKEVAGLAVGHAQDDAIFNSITTKRKKPTPAYKHYKRMFLNALEAIEYTLSRHGDEDWLRAWVEADNTAIAQLKEWVDNGKPD